MGRMGSDMWEKWVISRLDHELTSSASRALHAMLRIHIEANESSAHAGSPSRGAPRAFGGGGGGRRCIWGERDAEMRG